MGERRGRLSDEDRAIRAAHVSYGSIIVLAVLVAEKDTAVRAGEAIASVIGAAAVTALAEFYAAYVAGTIRTRRHPTGAERVAERRNLAAGFLLAAAPAAVLVLEPLGVLSLKTAFDVAIWGGIGLLAAQAFAADRAAGFGVTRSLATGVGFALLGAALVVLKSLA